MKKPIRVAMLGVGRIGKMHTRNILTMKEFEVVTGMDPYLTAEQEAELLEMGLPKFTRDPDEVFNDPTIDAVIISSVTETHSDLIIRAARKKMDVFCEKPIDHDVPRIREALKAVKEEGVILQIGFNHRFDLHHGSMQRMIAEGRVGDVEVLKITSRDPAPPSMKYIQESGGIFVDFMIHDFDMARFLTGSEVVEVFATGTSVCDPQISEYGDVGSGHAVLKFANGAIGILEVSRRSSFGHDQRIEALGSKGCVMDDNVYENNVRLFNETGYHGAKVPYHFPERYKEAYFDELRAFAASIENRTQPLVTGFDGLQAVLIAEAAARSFKSGKLEKVEIIDV